MNNEKLNELVRRFEDFPDATVGDIHVFAKEKKVIATINCANAFRDYKYEVIEFTFRDVSSTQVILNRNKSAVFGALICMEGDEVLFDFFPDFDGGVDKYKERPNSFFKVRCKDVDYEYIKDIIY